MKKLILFASLIMLLSNCSNNKSNEKSALVSGDSVEVMEMPEVPSDITDPNLRANYLLEHFWDNLNFKDTTRTYDLDFVQQNFANFASILPYASDTLKIMKGFEIMLSKAEVDRKAYDIFRETTEKYLFDPNSPMLSEDAYRQFLHAVLKSDYISTDEKEKYRYQLHRTAINRPGMKATDFTYTTVDGRRMTLQGSLAKNDLMLIFFDPDCENCDEILGKLQQNQDLAADIRDGRISVLAIYVGDDEAAWRKKVPTMPEEWVIGMNQNIDEDDLYYLPAMPTIYIIDNKGYVVAKDIRV